MEFSLYISILFIYAGLSLGIGLHQVFFIQRPKPEGRLHFILFLNSLFVTAFTITSIQYNTTSETYQLLNYHLRTIVFGMLFHASLLAFLYFLIPSAPKKLLIGLGTSYALAIALLLINGNYFLYSETTSFIITPLNWGDSIIRLDTPFTVLGTFSFGLILATYAIFFFLILKNLQKYQALLVGLLILFFTIIYDQLISFNLLNSIQISHIGGLIWIVIAGLSLTQELKETLLIRKQLVQSEDRFQSLFNMRLIGLAISQGDRIVYANEECQEIVNIPKSDFDITDIAFDENQYRKLTEYQYLIDQIGSESGNIEVRIKSSKLRTDPIIKSVLIRIAPTEYNNQKAHLLAMVDITRTKNLENLIQIREKMASLGHVAAGIAHEIRNPLSGIDMAINTLRKQIPQDETRIFELIQLMEKSSLKISAVVKRVLDFAKPTNPKLVLISIPTLIDDCMVLLGATLRKSKVRYTITTSNPPKILGDTQLLDEVFINIITNAESFLKNLDKERLLTIDIQHNNDSVSVLISDNGPGIPEASRKKIFDPFFSTRSEGTGIGLSISQRIVTDHNGKIFATSNEMGGATFVISFPIPKSAT